MGGQENDRVYLLLYSNSDTRYFYYMQEKESDGDLDNVVLLNKYLSNFKKAATAAGDETYLASLNTTTSTSSTTPQQIDALSSILENLVPPSSSAPAATPIESSAAAPSATATAGALTLADLQGAMAGLAQPSPSTAPLTEVLNPNLVEESGILSNPDVQEKLLSLLPPNTSNKN